MNEKKTLKNHFIIVIISNKKIMARTRIIFINPKYLHHITFFPIVSQFLLAVY